MTTERGIQFCSNYKKYEKEELEKIEQKWKEEELEKATKTNHE